MNIICTYLLAYYTVKLNGSLMPVQKKSARGYQYYANMHHIFCFPLNKTIKFQWPRGENRLNHIHREIPLCYLLFLVLQNSPTMLRTKWHFYFAEINTTANKKLFRIKLNSRNDTNGSYIGILNVQEFIWIRLIKMIKND